jgi:hypothetical protein
MAQWKRLTTLCKENGHIQERVNELYRRINFPYKFRSQFAEWIESQDWFSIDESSDAGRKKAENLFKELLMKVNEVLEALQASQSYDLERMLDFNAAYHSFKQRFEGNYTAFATVISNCLREEHTLIDSTRPESPELRRKNKQLECKQQQKIIVEISQSLARLRQEIALADGELRNVATQQHEFILKLNEISESIANVERQLKSSLPATTRKEMEDTKMKLDQTKLQFIVQNFQQRNMIAEKHIKLACSLATELKRVWAEVEKWQDEQKKSITGLTNPSEGTLDILDTMYVHFIVQHDFFQVSVILSAELHKRSLLLPHLLFYVDW